LNRANRTKTLRLDEISVKFPAKYHGTLPLTHLPRWVSWRETGAKWWRIDDIIKIVGSIPKRQPFAAYIFWRTTFLEMIQFYKFLWSLITNLLSYLWNLKWRIQYGGLV